MKMVTKALVLLMALLMCVGCFAACGDGDVTTTGATTTTPPPGGVDPADRVNALLNNKSFDGQTCSIFYKYEQGPGKDLYTTETGISNVERASFNRLETIRERTGITIVGVKSNGPVSSSQNSADIGYLRELFSTNDPEQIPDIVMPGGYTASILAGEGLFLDLANENPFIDLSLDCWQSNVNDALSICGTYYGVSGTFSTANTGWILSLFVDKTSLASIATETLAGTAAEGFVDDQTLYDWVDAGEWTYPKMLALAMAFTGPEGGQITPGQYTEGDKYGFEYQGTASYSVFMATGKKYVAADPENYGIPKLMTDDPETVKVLNWLVDNVQAKPYVHDYGGNGTSEGGRLDPAVWGMSHNGLFIVGDTDHISRYSKWGAEDGSDVGTFDFGILPLPKFEYEDVAQDRYYCPQIAWSSTLACIPENCRDTVFSSFVLELITEMGYYAWDEGVVTIWEAYVKDGLQGRYAPDIRDEEMLEIIMQSAAADLGEFNVFDGVSPSNGIRGLYRSKSKTWEQWTETNKEKVDFAIEAMLVEMGLISYG